MAVAIKKSGYKNIIIYNGGIKDWIKSNNKVESTTPLPEIKVAFIHVDDLLASLTEADKQNCMDSDGNPLLTLIDFRISHTLQEKMGADKYQIQSRCRIIKAQLDDFIDNQQLIDTIPDTGQVISISETGNRDRFLIQFLSQYGKSNIRGLKYGMRNWVKSNYPAKIVPETDTRN